MDEALKHDSPKRSDKPMMENMDFDNTRDSLFSTRESDEDGPQLVLIDFEYCSYNYRGFDLANHFIEWSYDYTNPDYPFFYDKFENYPTQEQQERFITAYLQTTSNYYNGLASPSRSNRSSSGSELSNRDISMANIPEPEEVAQLLEEVKAFDLASHFFWGLWGGVNATLSQIPFGYWDYAVSRMERYQAAKLNILRNKSNFKRKINELEH